MKKIYTYILILFFGCGTPEKDVIDISPEYFVDEQLLLSDIAQDIEYIPLDSRILISSIVSIDIKDNFIIIRGGSDAGVVEYNRDGKFIRRIGRTGNGPGEYITPASIVFNEKAGEIYISDLKNFLIYDFEGNFLRAIPLNSNLKGKPDIVLNDDKLYWFDEVSSSVRNRDPFYWTVTDKQCNELYSKVSTTVGFRENKYEMGMAGNFVYRFRDKICYWNHYNDTIFELQRDSYRARYLFKQDRYRLTPELASTPGFRIGSDMHYVLYYISESQNYLFIVYRQNRELCLCLYDKNEKKFKRTILDQTRMGLNNDLDGGGSPVFYYSMYADSSNHDYLVSSVEAFQLKAIVSSEAFKNSTPKYPEKKKALEKLANSLNENDNPVLMLVKLKE